MKEIAKKKKIILIANSSWYIFNFRLSLLFEINKLSPGDYTNPITIPGGFIIIRLNEIKKEKLKIDINKEIEKVIKYKTNQQLNTFSNIYLKKIMKDNEIEKI